jgi:hypothetical protein
VFDKWQKRCTPTRLAVLYLALRATHFAPSFHKYAHYLQWCL